MEQQNDSGAPAPATTALESEAGSEPGPERPPPCYMGIALAFQDAVDSGDLDIYRVCAWVGKRSKTDIPPTDRAIYYGKALVCFCIQTAGLGLFLYVQMAPLFEDIAYLCYRSTNDISQYVDEIQALSVMFAFYISFRTGGQMFDIGRSGLYKLNMWSGEDCPPFVSRNWVFLGLYTNIFACFGSIIGSFVVLYKADDILNVILHSVALFFISDVDDFMLNKKDYGKINKWLQRWSASNKPEAAALEERPSIIDARHLVAATEYRPLGLAAKCLVSKCLTPISYALYALTVFIAMVAPIWISICH